VFNGFALKAIREARGFSQSLVAGLAGLSAPYLSELERGKKSTPDAAYVAMFAEILDVDPRALDLQEPPARLGQSHLLRLSDAARLLDMSSGELSMLLDRNVIKYRCKSKGGHRYVPYSEVIRHRMQSERG